MFRTSIRLFPGTLVLLAVSGTSDHVAFADPPTCKGVQGHLEETLVPQPACTSAVGLCTSVKMWGDLKGEAQFTASAFIVSGDTPVTGIVFVIGDTAVVNAELEG